MKTKTRILLLILVLLNACQMREITGTPPERENLQDFADSCREVYSAQIAAWDSGDLERIQEVYTEDIVHFDGHPAFVGIDAVMGMARMMLGLFGNWEMEAGRTYISASDCLGTWVNWGLMGLTEDDPGMEFDLIDIEGDQISYWRLFYDQNFDFAPINTSLLEDFASAWSSADPQAIAGLYGDDALLEDSLFGISAAGREQIGRVAAGFNRKHPQAAWELIYSFSEGADLSDLMPSHGGIYRVTSEGESGEVCQVEVAVILTPDPDGKIAAQMTMYSAEDLIECGWVK